MRDTATLDGITLAYELRGTGEPVVLVHAGVLANWYAPLLEEPALTDRFRLLSYQRVNYGGSTHLSGPVSIEDHAAHCRALMDCLGIERAHLVGHSSGGIIALQVALDGPEAVDSLVLLEPALTLQFGGPPTPPAFMAQAIERCAAGDKAGAVDTFMRGVCGDEYRAVVDAVLPGAFDQAVADADGFIGQELPAVREWGLSPEDAARVEQPVLVITGDQSPPVFELRQRWLLEHLPRAEAFTLAGAGHLLHVQQPRAMAEALAVFFGRHPLAIG